MYRIPKFMLVLGMTSLLRMTSLTSASEAPPLTLPGDVIIGVMGELHKKSSATGGEECKEVNLQGMEEVAAAQWALDTINNQSHNDYTIGLRVYDVCGGQGTALRQAVRLLQDTQHPNQPLLGVVTLGSASMVSETMPLLQAFTTPVLLTDVQDANSVSPAENVFTAAPHLADQLQAVLSAARHVGGSTAEVGVVSGSVLASQLLKERASRSGLRIRHILQVSSAQSNITHQVTEFITNKVGFGGVVVVVVKAAQLNLLSSQLEAHLLQATRLRWIFSSLLGEPSFRAIDEEALKKKFSGSLLVEAYSPLLSGFQHYFSKSVKSNASLIAPLVSHYTHFLASNCDGKPDRTSSTPSGTRCPPQKVTIPSGVSATGTVRAVSSLAAAFRLVQIEKCSNGVRCLQALRHDLHQDVMKALLKLSFAVKGNKDEGIRYTAYGRLIDTYIITSITSKGLQKVGVYRQDTGVVWSPNESLPVRDHGREMEAIGLVVFQDNSHKSVHNVLLTRKDYFSRPWAFFVLGLASLGILVTVYVGMSSALQVWEGPSSGHQVFDIVLLFGVMGVYGSSFGYIQTPSVLSCILRQWMPGLSLALSFSILLVKAMHFQVLMSRGPSGTDIPYASLFVSLIFMVGVQGCLCLFRYTSSSLIINWKRHFTFLRPGTGDQCREEQNAVLFSRVYLIFLLLLTLAFLALKRKTYKNHCEFWWLLLSSFVSVLVVGLWTVASYLAPPSMEVPTTIMGLLILASVMLGLIFLPKLRNSTKRGNQFKHKQLQGVPSISTIFMHTDGIPQDKALPSKDGIQNSSENPSLGCRTQTYDSQGPSVRQPQSAPSHQATASASSSSSSKVPADSDCHVLRNPVYDVTHAAYP